MNSVLKTSPPRCPSCRLPVTRRDAHPLHLEIVDSKAALQTYVTERLEEMQADAPASDVRKAGQKLDEIALNSSGYEENFVRILSFGPISTGSHTLLSDRVCF